VPDPSDPPAYTKYRAGRVRAGRGEVSDLPVPGAPAGDREPRPYSVHRAGGDPPGGGRPRGLRRGGGGPRRRLPVGRIAWRLVLFLVAWVLFSGVVFLVSAFVHRDDVGTALTAGGTPPFGTSTIMVLGSDARPKGTKEPGGASSGSRADSILLMRLGGGASSRLSIPRDTVADIPGHRRSKINAAFAYGGAALMAKTIEANLGVRVNHVVEVSFSNFPVLIDAMGGVTYTGGCVVSRISGGARNGGTTLRLKAGSTHIDGKQALALARTRHNDCNKRESDLTRASRQQKLFSAMKSRLISPGAFVRLPFISWAAPKSLRSDMGGPTLLGVFGALATSGTPPTRILRPTGVTTLPDGGQALTVSDAAKQAAVRRFLAG
jgi:LCP family protein required for cell wall assembly